jgi:hypothetical protein
MAPVTNAVLTAISGPGAPDAYGDPGTPGSLWSGRARGYLKRVRKTVVSGGEQVEVRRDIFTILASAGAPVLEVAGPDWEATTVTIEDHRGTSPVTRSFAVVMMENRAAGTSLDSVRLELDTEKVPA